MNHQASNRGTRSAPALLLQRELAERIGRNPRYSLRAFAKTLGMSHALLSMILSGKRSLSPKGMKRVVEVLGLSPTEQNRYFAPIKSKNHAVLSYRQIDVDHFALISDWYHYAILSLLEVPGSNVDPKWIAGQLGINPAEASLAVQRLKRMGLIAKVKNRWKQVGDPIDCQNSVSTAATRKFQRQMLQKAAEVLESVPIEKRDFSSMTLATDPKLLPYAAKRIDDFRKELTAELEAHGKPKVVYNLAIQFFPVTPVPDSLPKEKS